MKRILLLTFVMGIMFSGFAQRPTVSKDLRNFTVEMVQPTLETMNLTHDVLPASVPEMTPAEDIIGMTYYDLQSNSSMQNRIFVYDDGTMGGVFTLGFDFPGFSGDRGTGYNYYDGTSWDDWPEERIEDGRSGWPAYSAWANQEKLTYYTIQKVSLLDSYFQEELKKVLVTGHNSIFIHQILMLNICGPE